MKSEPLHRGGPDAPDETADRLAGPSIGALDCPLNVLQEAIGTQSVSASLQGMEAFEVWAALTLHCWSAIQQCGLCRTKTGIKTNRNEDDSAWFGHHSLHTQRAQGTNVILPEGQLVPISLHSLQKLLHRSEMGHSVADI